MTRTTASLLWLGCWLGAAFGAKSWEVPPTRDLWNHIDPDLDGDWRIYLKTYNKSYSESEELTRRFYWEDTLRYIQWHNLRYDRGEVEYYLGENKLADMAEDEIEKIYLQGLVVPEEEEEFPEALTEPDPDAPVSVDWTKEGYVSSVKDQGECGSCWAFSAVGALEGQHKKKTGRLVDLSAQNLVDCANKKYGNLGCRGGWMNNAFRYISDNEGISNEQCYAYVARDQQCRYRQSCRSAEDRGSRNVGRTENSLQSAVASIGPIAVAMDANHRSFFYYRGGIYDGEDCIKTQLNHAMLATGYGTFRERDYWTVKNSWGTTWGVNGYLYIRRNNYDRCGISQWASYPIV